MNETRTKNQSLNFAPNAFFIWIHMGVFGLFFGLCGAKTIRSIPRKTNDCCLLVALSLSLSHELFAFKYVSVCVTHTHAHSHTHSNQYKNFRFDPVQCFNDLNRISAAIYNNDFSAYNKSSEMCVSSIFFFLFEN